MKRRVGWVVSILSVEAVSCVFGCVRAVCVCGCVCGEMLVVILSITSRTCTGLEVPAQLCEQCAFGSGDRKASM